MLGFEWDEAKRQSNIRKHGIDFKDAVRVFSDPSAVELIDDREDYGEERFVTIGMASPGLLTVVSTSRQDKCRIISARPASKFESKLYAENAD